MTRATAIFSISVPPEMAVELDRVRKVEHRTRSELVREALRHYMRAASIRSVRERAALLPEVEPDEDEIAAVQEGRRQFEAVKPKVATRGLARRRRR